jgi:hypothetical protein
MTDPVTRAVPATTGRRSLRLVPREDIFLTPTGHGDEPRFARLFRRAWRRLPPLWRRAILAHGRSRAPSGVTAPRVELLDDWPGLADHPGNWHLDYGVFSDRLDDGWCLRFHAGAVDLMPAVLVQGLVAYELAHVGLRAAGDSSRGGPREFRKDVLLARWGFDPFARDTWWHQNVKHWSPSGPVWRDPPVSEAQVQLYLTSFSNSLSYARYYARPYRTDRGFFRCATEAWRYRTGRYRPSDWLFLRYGAFAAPRALRSGGGCGLGRPFIALARPREI